MAEQALESFGQGWKCELEKGATEMDFFFFLSNPETVYLGIRDK